MKTTLIFLFTIILSVDSLCQEIFFVKDDVMDNYMITGIATKHFRPQGMSDENKMRQGEWKDYESIKDFEYIEINGEPTQIFGRYLLYGEGKFVNNNREGFWKMYVIEDESFNKILQKEVS